MPARTSTAALTALLAAAACGLSAGPASASDETLKAEIASVLPEITPTLTAFVKEAKAAEKTGKVTKLRAATLDVREGISRYKWSVVNRKASTDQGLAGKQALLVAIREYDIGFAAYTNALDKATSGASRASTIKSLKSFAKRIDEASKDEAAALEQLGVNA